MYQDSQRSVVKGTMLPMMTPDEIRERVMLHEISNHAHYFMAACLMQSIGGGAQLLNTTPKSVCNHIKWLERLVGGRLLQDLLPGQTMKLTSNGKKLMEELHANFTEALTKLKAEGKVEVVGKSFVEVIKSPIDSFKPQNPMKAN